VRRRKICGKNGSNYERRRIFATGVEAILGLEVMTMKKIFSIVVLSFVSTMLSVHAADNMKAFPPAEAGMVRHVLQLPKQSDESAFKVELIVGKTVQVDAVNSYFFAGKIEEETIEGWGFPRYNVSKLGSMAGTLMAVDPDAPKVSRFITLGGEPYFIRYNSQLPIVVYAPEGVEVKYRVWSAGPEVKVIDKG
jgi:ecotin